ncbi:methyl-accepting chemotaxis protein [Microbacteriaceae bacterium K1510]|nr:methyl-accepting chemotaxis protein [Microbacteriaceae bacterium K1510]
MLNRLSVSVLLKSIVGLLAGAIILTLAIGSWSSWTRLRNANRNAQVAEVSISLFAGSHTTRLDRTTTFRDLQADGAVGVSPILRDIRTKQMTALKSSLVVLKQIELPADAVRQVATFEEAINKMSALQEETAAALAQPKSARRAGLADEYVRQGIALSSLLDRVTSSLVNLVKLDDAYIDQLIQLKELAWIARNTGGDASTTISNAVSGLPMPPDTLLRYAADMARVETAWSALGSFSSGLSMPPRFIQAVQKAQDEFFSRENMTLRLNILTKALAKEKLDITPQEWLRSSVGKLMTLLGVAEAALDTAKEHAIAQSARAQRNLMMQLALLVAAIAVSAIAMLMITRRITNPLVLVQQTVVKVAGGDFTSSLSETKRKDEIGQIITAVNEMVMQVSATIGNIKASAREVTNASSEIASATSDLSQRTEEQAASLEETSASMEEISATVRKNAENAQRAQNSALATQKVADHGGDVAGRAVQAMARIEESSGKIADIIGVIDEIARQTNLLALNAAVEAARAGEAGRGFAVVATEVRSLAQRSSQAAKDIAELITNSGSQVKEGVGLVNQAGEALNGIVESIREVATLVSDIATASAEQAQGLEEVGKALSQMDEVTQRNSALVEENAATAHTLEQQAKAMDEQVAYFRTDEATAPSERAAATQHRTGQLEMTAREASPVRTAA